MEYINWANFRVYVRATTVEEIFYLIGSFFEYSM